MTICIFCKADSNGNFCHQCGATLPASEEEYLITDYFRKGFQYKSIIRFLNQHHQIQISLRTLKSRLKEYGLKRKCMITRQLELDTDYAILKELNGPSQKSGYRTMQQRLALFHNIFVPRSMVMFKLQVLDPSGCSQRRKHKLERRQYSTLGPNHLWHADGYDKLKPFGFPIHGCIDGYSRKIIWLKTVHSNNDPIVIGKIFIDAIEEVEGCPRRFRTDCGSENVTLAAIQSFLRRNDVDSFAGVKAHIYGTSHHNQRIESWWSFYRRNRSSYIITMFKELVEGGIFNPGNMYHLTCARYCFSTVLQNDLDEIVEQWNTHYIRKSSSETIPGRPEELYSFPEVTGGEEQLLPVDDIDLNEMKIYIENKESEMQENELEKQIYTYFDYVMKFKQFTFPRSWEEARNLYCKLVVYES